MRLKDKTLYANTGLDAIKRAPIVEHDTGLKCIRIQDISQGKGYNEWGFTETNEKDRNKFSLKKNDLLVARTGATVGVSQFIKEDIEAVHNNGTIRLRLDKSLNARFVYYIFQTKSFLQYIDNISCVATQPNLRIEGLLRFTIPDYSIERQDKIVEILSMFDDLIENNNKRIKLLEQMAENLYREWFVRFRFPEYEDVEFEDGIPEGWKRIKLKELIKRSGKSIKKENLEESYKYVPIDFINSKSIVLRKYDDLENASSSLQTFQEKDILFGAMRPYFHKVSIADFKGVTRSTCFVIRPIEEDYLYYVLMMLFQESTVNFATTISVGSTMPYVRWEDFVRMNTLKPTKSVISDFYRKMAPLIKEMNILVAKNEKLAKQRDLLLPRLMSGKLEV